MMPSPAPISTTRSPPATPARRTSSAASALLRRKCWERCGRRAPRARRTATEGHTAHLVLLRRTERNTTRMDVRRLAFGDEEPVGMLLGHELDRRHGDERKMFLYEIDVREDRRRHGIGPR